MPTCPGLRPGFCYESVCGYEIKDTFVTSTQGKVRNVPDACLRCRLTVNAQLYVSYVMDSIISTYKCMWEYIKCRIHSHFDERVQF